MVRLIRPNEYNPETDGGEGFQFTYDAEGRVLTVVSPEGHVLQSNTYDASGRLIQRVDGVGSGVKYEYDFTGAQRRMESMGGASQELEYDAQGRITGVVDGNGNETRYLLDEWGRITGVVKADGSTERYAYNFAGDMVSSTDGEGHTTRYEYNRMGKISAIVDPTGEKETYHYDGQGRLIRRTDRNGVTVELGYNLYGAPLFQKEKDGAQGDFYEYTPEGLLKCAISEGMRYAYEYDAMGRMIRKSASGRTLLALSYDKNGNKVRQIDVTGKLTGFDYDTMGQLLRLTDDGQELAAYTYNPDGTPQAVTHGPIRQEYAYDLDKNLTGLTVRSGDAMLSQASYTYDGNGNRIRKQALDGTTLYQYDALNQLQRVDYPAYSEELFYDKAGNRARRLMGGEEELYQYDPRNRLMAYTKNGATTPFQYDNAGNLLRDDKAKYTYDAFNRTTKVETFDGNVQVNRYDAEGLRHVMEENGRLVRFIFHKGEAVAEQEENSNVIRLIRGSELIARSSDSESARTYYHYASDEMGSTTHIVDDNGNVQNRYAYDAWGKITVREEAVPNRFTYYGQQIDPITQQYYLRARFYNPIIGRFTQEDTYRGDGLNLYAYCANNPVFYVDPSGYYKDGVFAAEQAKRRLKQTPKGPENATLLDAGPIDRGVWTGKRGESTYIPKNAKLRELLKSYGVEGVTYENNIPDFMKFVVNIQGDDGQIYAGIVTITGMAGGKTGRISVNFPKATLALSQKSGIPTAVINKLIADKKLTWHECNDMKTMILIPTVINQEFGHMGGVGEINLLFDLLEGKL